MKNTSHEIHNLSLEEKKALLLKLLREKSGEAPETSLSSAQSRLWLLEQLIPGSGLYHIPLTFQINGPLDVECLKSTLQEIVRRHQILRTIFVNTTRGVMQKVIKNILLPFNFHDLSSKPVNSKNESIENLLRKKIEEPFNLTSQPLFRVDLFRISENEHVFSFVIHHILFDARSVDIFIQELITIYDSLYTNTPLKLPPLPFQYADYVTWQNNFLKGEQAQKQLEYWKNKLKGAPSFFSLPINHPRPPVQTSHGATEDFVISKETSDGLRKLGQKEGATSFMVFLAAFKTLLYRYTGEMDIVVGTPITNRNQQEIENLMGFFVNTLVLRTELGGDLNFLDLLRKVRETALEAYANQDLPFEKLVEEINPPRNMTHSPLFQVMFNFQNDSPKELTISGLSFRPINSKLDTSKFDLSLTLQESKAPQEEIRGELEYNTDIFPSSFIQRMIKNFQVLLQSIILQPTNSISTIPLLASYEKDEILSFNKPRIEIKSKTIPHLIDEQAQKSPEAIALSFENQNITYAELQRRSNQIASQLQLQGLKRGDLAGIYLERSPDIIIVMLAILKAGAAYVPIDLRYPQDRISYLIQDSGLRFLITTKSLSNSLYLENLSVLMLEEIKPEILHKISNKTYDLNIEDLAYVMYTSGSTGTPKGVMVTHVAFFNFIQWYMKTFKLTPGHRMTQIASISFDASALEIWPTLAGGATLCLVPQDLLGSPKLLQEWLINHHIHSTFMPTPLWESMRSLQWPAHIDLKTLHIGGEALHHSPPPFLPFRVINHYGPTENSVVTSWEEVSPNSFRHFPSIGRPIDNVEIYILDQNLNLVPLGVPGEIFIGGLSLASGYYRQLILSQEKFIQHPFKNGERIYRSGDIGRYLSDGTIEFLGRTDHQVKIRGLRIELGEIESVLCQNPNIQKAVVATQGEGISKQLLAYILLQENQTLTANDLRKNLKEKLPEYMIPSFFIFLKEFPLTSSGKINRKALPAPDGTRPEDMREYVAPRNETEEKLATIWREVLGIEKIGIFDNFFELGGHSLLAIQIISRLRNSLGYQSPLRLIFQNPTIADLSQALEQEKELKTPFEYPPLIPVPRNQKLPLSFAQERLWFLDQMEPGNPFYNIPVALRLRGHLQRQALEQTLNEIVKRHEALRTVFETMNGEPVQTIKPLSFSLTVTDLRNIPDVERKSQLQSLVEKEALKPFDLAHGPLFRAQLIQDEEKAFVLLITTHHIVFDGSQNIFANEFVSFYEAFSEGHIPQVSILPIQYADFAQWQRNLFEKSLIQNQLIFWKQKLGENPPILQLPTDRPRPTTQSFQGTTRNFKLNISLTERLKKLSQKEGTSLFSTLLSGFFVLLYRYTEQEDIIVGSPYLDRPQVETENLIGCFVNTLVYRAQPTANQSFREFLTQVRQVILEAQENKDIPFEKLVNEIRHKRNLSYSPLFQVMFSFNSAPREKDLALPKIEISFLETTTQSSRFDWLLALTEDADGLTGSIEYSTDLFDHSTIERMLTHFENILEGVVTNPDEKITRLPLITSAEKSQTIFEWNKTESKFPRDTLIHELFEAQVQQNPEAIAVVGFIDQQKCEWTYEELNHKSNQLAHHLKSLGIGSGSLVGVYMSRSPHMIPTLLAIFKAGGAYVPLDVSHPVKRVQQILSSLNIQFIITQEKHNETIQGWRQELPDLKHIVCMDDPLNTKPTKNLSRQCSATDLAYIIFTSGSTGTPKGVMVRHRPVINLIDWAQKTFPVNFSDRLLFITSLGFDLSVYDIFGILAAGGSIRVASHEELRNPEQLVEILCNEPITFWDSAPAALQQLIPLLPKTNSDKLYPLKRVFLSGDWIPVTLPDQIRNVFRQAEIISLGGATEATVWSNYFPIGEVSSEWTSIPYGKPIQNAKYHILDTHLNPCPIGIPGDLYIGGECLSSGYINAPELTSQKFIPDPFTNTPGSLLYKTGDRARYRADGNMEFLGRQDHQVKIRGFRIELGEIETALAGHQSIRESAVCILDDRSEKYLTAYIALHEGQTLTSGDLKGFLKQLLPEPMIPSSVVFLEKLPLSANGKVDRKALTALGGEKFERTTEYVPPRNEVEKKLVKIWQEVLGIEKIGINDDFFELGGHSLLAVLLLAKIKTNFNVMLSLQTIFECSSINFLSDYIMEKNVTTHHDSQEKSIVPILRHSNIEISFAQERRLFYTKYLFPHAPNIKMHLALKLTGELNINYLEMAINLLVSRHEVLRTTFINKDGKYFQCISDKQHISLKIKDISQLKQITKDKQLSHSINEALEYEIDIGKGPLLQFDLFVSGKNNYILLCQIEHIIFDGWSIDVFNHDISEYYNSLVENRKPNLPELSVQYGDYVMWERNQIESERYITQLEYWKKQISDVTTLPTDYPRKGAKTFNGAMYDFSLTSGLSRDLTHLSSKNKTTLFTLCLGGLYALIYNTWGESDICIGCPNANRSPQIERLIGYFLNYHIYRMNLSTVNSFKNLLDKTKKTVIEVFQNADTPFVQLLKNISFDPSKNITPFFQIEYQFYEFAHSNFMQLQNIEITPYTIKDQKTVTAYDLNLSLTKEKGIIYGSFLYNTDLFKKSTISNLVSTYKAILQTMVNNLDQPFKLISN